MKLTVMPLTHFKLRATLDNLFFIDNKRLLKKTGELNQETIDLIKSNLSIVLDL